MNKTERAQLQDILVEYIENPRKMGGCILDIESLFRVVHDRWLGLSVKNRGSSEIAEEIVETALEKHKIGMRTLKGKSRSARVLLCRAEIITKLDEAGFSHSEIGRTINRHPSTVLHTLNKVAEQ